MNGAVSDKQPTYGPMTGSVIAREIATHLVLEVRVGAGLEENLGAAGRRMLQVRVVERRTTVLRAKQRGVTRDMGFCSTGPVTAVMTWS